MGATDTRECPETPAIPVSRCSAGRCPALLVMLRFTAVSLAFKHTWRDMPGSSLSGRLVPDVRVGVNASADMVPSSFQAVGSGTATVLAIKPAARPAHAPPGPLTPRPPRRGASPPGQATDHPSWYLAAIARARFQTRACSGLLQYPSGRSPASRRGSPGLRGRGGSAAPLVVAMTVCALDQHEMSGVNALYKTLFCSDVE